MASNGLGYIKLQRKLREHRLWPGKRGRSFTGYEALQDMLLSAKGVAGDGLNRGELKGSIRFFSMRWLWSLPKTQRFLNSLKKDETIIFIEPSDKTDSRTIKFVNYDQYNPKKADTGTDRGTDRGKSPDNKELPLLPDRGTDRGTDTNKMKDKRKRNTLSPEFEEFWKLIPSHRKVGKAKCFLIWKKLPPVVIPGIIKSMTAWVKCEDWTREDGKWVPNPKKWLEEGRWEVEPKKPKKQWR